MELFRSAKVCFSGKRFFLFSSIVLLLITFTSAFAQNASVERGQELYENQCSYCHDKNLHERQGRRANSVSEVRIWVTAWAIHSGIDWGIEEVEDVTLYLSRYLYDFDV